MLLRAATIGVALLALALASPARAALTTAEKAEALKLYTAYNSLLSAEASMKVLVRDHSDDATTVTALATVWGHVITFWDNLIDAQGYLLGGNIHEFGSASYTTLEAQSRATWVANAWTAVASAAATKALVDTAATAAKAHTDATGDTLLQDVMDQVSAALGVMQSVSQVATYPDGRTGAEGSGRIIGPHGTYTVVQHRLIRVLKLLNAAQRSLKEMYDTPTLGESIWSSPSDPACPENNFGPSCAFWAIIAAHYERVGLNAMATLFNMALIPTTITECGYSDLQLVFRSMERLLSHHSESSSLRNVQGMAYSFVVSWALWNDAFRNGGLTTRPLAHAKWIAFKRDHLKAWTQSSGAAWDPLEFPTAITLAGANATSLRGQATVIQTANTTPLCNATTNPTATWTYPANAQTVGGRLTAQWACRDNVTAVKGRIKIDGVEIATDLARTNNGISTYSFSGTTENGNPTVTSGNVAIGFVVGDAISGTGIQAGTTVAAINSHSTITLSQNATATGTATLTTQHPVTFSYPWDTASVSNGAHTLQGICYDNALNSAETTEITVTVAN